MKKACLSIFAILLLSVSVLAQPVQKAEKKMKLYNYSKAIKILSKSMDKPEKRAEVIPLLAECYRMQQDVFNAKVWYAQAVALPEAKPEWYYYYAQALRSTGEYELAGKMFLKYAEMQPDDPKGKLYAGFCDSVSKSWKYKAPQFEIRPVANINSPQSDFGPAFFKGQLVFASDRNMELDESGYGWTGRGYLDILSSNPAAPNEFWGDMKAPASFKGKFNQTYHDGPATFGKDNSVYFTRTILQDAKNVNKIRTNLLKIFYSSETNGSWSKLEPFFLNSPDYSVGHPALSADGTTLCFVSDMSGGAGGTDLWICRKQSGSWGKPENLSNLNTQGNEMFPSFTENGSLIYSSDYLPGYGGLDLFIAKVNKENWSAPENMGAPLNSSFDDFALNYAPGSKNGFFSSNRPGGNGSDDIYAFNQLDIPAPVIPAPVEVPKPYYISGVVKDKISQKPIEGATVFVLNPNTGKVSVLKTDADGVYTLLVDRAAELTIKAMKPRHIADCMPFQITEIKPGTTAQAPRDLFLDKLEVNKTFKIDNIYYDFDKFNIREDAKPELDKLVRIMNENPINVELGSHTDSRGSFAYNDKLSQNRAESAVNYIVSTGISPSRITAKGYGEHQLVNKCSDGVKCSDEEHQANRRTEFKVIGYSQPNAVDQFDPDKFYKGEELDIRLMPGGFFNPCK